MTKEDAIEYLRDERSNAICDERFTAEWVEVLDMAIKALEQEPKTGYWVHGEYCSECGCDVPAYIIDWKWQKDMNAKYCPNCGADMRGKEE